MTSLSASERRSKLLAVCDVELTRLNAILSVPK
jgi:hypothetical protein